MKTFETEKGRIPEGATHYSDETEGKYFCWYNIGGVAKICVLDGVGFGHKWHKCTNEHKGADVKPIPWPTTETPEEKEALDAIEQVEWKNGDSCRYANDISHEYIYIGEHPHGDGHYVFSEDKGVTYIANGYLLEPESQEAKKEREELERRAMVTNAMCLSVTSLRLSQANALYDAGYIKGE